ECWKCFGAEMDEHVTATPPKPVLEGPQRQLRSSASVLIRMAIGFGVGFLLGGAVFHRFGASLAQAALSGAIAGVVVGVVVGIFVWVVFPYESLGHSPEDDSEPTESLR